MASRSMQAATHILSGTATPFLYQTRTLTSKHWQLSHSITRIEALSRANKRLFHYSIPHPNEEQLPTESSQKEQLALPRIQRYATSRRDEHQDDRQDDRKINAERAARKRQRRLEEETAIPWGNEDSGKQDDILANMPDQEPWSEFSHGFSGMDYDSRTMEDSEGLYEKNNPTFVESSSRSTITPSEQRAFEKLFSDMFAKSAHQQQSIPTLSSQKETRKATTNNMQSKLDDILGNALNPRLGKQPLSRAEMIKVVNQYPVALRSAAAKAIGLATEPSDASESAGALDAVPEADGLEEIRQPERERVGALLHAAKTDFEVWQIMEKEVFSLVTKMGLNEPLKSKKRRASKKSLQNATPTISEIGENRPSSLHIYGPLYPSHLLLSLRILDRAFAKPSSLSLAIIPRIKSLGLVSQVLGGSTALYNELLRINWLRHENLPAVLSLLEEMERAGLELDEETLSIVKSIVSFQRQVLKGEKGDAAKLILSLPEHQMTSAKIRGWINKIEVSLHERKSEMNKALAY